VKFGGGFPLSIKSARVSACDDYVSRLEITHRLFNVRISDFLAANLQAALAADPYRATVRSPGTYVWKSVIVTLDVATMVQFAES
jgi:hypothetical protein